MWYFLNMPVASKDKSGDTKDILWRARAICDILLRDFKEKLWKRDTWNWHLWSLPETSNYNGVE